MDRDKYEKLSIIKESSSALKKYGSTSRHVTKNENYVKHYVTNSDTLQGIALKYNVTIEQIRRINKLWASDSLFLKEFLLVPVPDGAVAVDSSQSTSRSSSSEVQSPVIPSSTRSGSFDEENIFDFLNKIDASIASTKEDVKKTSKGSGFVTSSDEYHSDRRKPATSRMKQVVNNNSSNDLYSSPNTVGLSQGKTVKNSIEHHEHQQDELFEL